MLRNPLSFGWSKTWILAFAALPFVMSSCEEDEEPEPMTNTIVDVASSDARFSSLVEAVTIADLAGTLSGMTEYTVFAPDNDAFQDLLDSNPAWNTLADIDVDVLTQVLLNHVVAGTVRSTDLTDGYVKSLATEAEDGNALDLFVDLSSGVVINGDVTVEEADIDADNGVIHQVGSVIGLTTVVDLALDNPAFSTLVAALTRSDLTTDYVTTLSGDGPFTVFAPTNDAFQDLLDSDPTWNTLADIPVATLEAVLNYHVIAGSNILSSELSDGDMPTTFGGSDLTINVGTGVSITTTSGGTANVAIADVQSNNGVVHAIDAVLVP
jgi:transforming growth factor-beta-induced protein